MCGSVLRCVAVCCCVFWCVAVCCSVLQCVLTRIRKQGSLVSMQYVTATHCNTLQHTATHCNAGGKTHWHTLPRTLQYTLSCRATSSACSMSLQHTKTRCNALQNTLQHAATHIATYIATYIGPQGSLVSMQYVTATRCNTLQHAATHTATLIRPQGSAVNIEETHLLQTKCGHSPSSRLSSLCPCSLRHRVSV